jgi:fumarate hydratase class II
MNANEVIANRAAELMGGVPGDKSVHPNDHINRSQSSNDVIPTAIHLAALAQIDSALIPALKALQAGLAEKSEAYGGLLKIGRTHLQDATPISLGQEFSGYASQIAHGIARLKHVQPHLAELPLGGTAVGTGINAHPDFARRTIARLAAETRLPLREAPDHFEAQGARDACVETGGALKTVAVSLIRIANDIRHLGSGPRCGLGELRLPPIQPGSSLMPGKVNPVMCEMMIQVGAQVMGNDTVITFSGATGNFELNAMLPVIAYNLLQSIELLTNASRVFASRCVDGLEADTEQCGRNVERSLALGTALVPEIGYDRAAEIAKVAQASGRTIREVAVELLDFTESELDQLLNPRRLIQPVGTDRGTGSE